ncbi:protein C12orf4 homolog [Lutzomyia longipalpis]|uniref:protein C12orf4 homolog n=1 Tax=Lutzomyia longipalpis TaxID=7200 RepID=UPI0024844308|nr:protein C12orf4 homolog [Lutzomyia longipalpis]
MTSSATFEYTYRNYDGMEKTLKHQLDLPFKEDCAELAHRLVAELMDPVMKILDADIELKTALKAFVEKENQNFYDRRDEDLLNKARNGQVDVEGLVTEMDKLYKEEVLEFAERVGPTDEEIFALAFHQLVHSPLLPDILTKEQCYAASISELNTRMYEEIDELNKKQAAEMDETVGQLDVSTTSEDINALLSQHYSNQNLLRKRWESKLEAKRGHQKHEYRNWVTSQVGEALINNPTSLPVTSTPIGNKSSMFVTQNLAMEESFTIHLGSQLKHMHNIRILSADVTEFCSPLHRDENLNGLNMALGLYSSSLSGIVVLTPPGSVQALPKIIKNANMSTEFHFDQIENQIERIEEDLRKSHNDAAAGGATEKTSQKLHPGDFFITRHSNLSQTHVIFHLISDESSDSPGEITSRHPVILGLRNILKTASRHDISMLTIPALLRHEMSEDMTVPWSIRRAELVFKCAKGFMIESATWGGTEINTLQLLLPHNISEELFTTLAGMVSNVFRVANPKFL